MAAKAAALDADAVKPVTGDGAPSYTSGVHMWNGTAATLNAKPTRSRARPENRRPLLSAGGVSRKKMKMSARRVEPVAPYVRAIPYRKNADEKLPRMKYFIPDSCDSIRRR